MKHVSVLRSMPVLICLAAVMARHASASAVAVVLSDDQPATQEALRGVLEVLPNARALALAEAGAGLAGAGVVVTLGQRASGQRYDGAARMVAALVMDPGLELPAGSAQVSPLPDAFSLMATVRGLAPELQVLGVLTGSGQYQPYVHYLEAAGKVTGVRILAKSVDSAPDLVSALRGMQGKAQALWLAPTPLLLGQKNFQFVSDYCRSTKLPLIAPVPELAGAGALAGVAPSAHDQGRAAGLAAKDLAAGKPVERSINVEQNKVIISAKVAASLGLKVGPRDGEIVP